MIVYESDIKNFINECNRNIIAKSVANAMSTSFIGFSSNEEHSWMSSLPYMAKVLDSDDIDDTINVAIEYKSQLNKSRIDFLVYGKNAENKDSLVIIELKQWSKANSCKKPNYVHTIGGGSIESDYFHPSYQSLRYKYMLSGFNEYVQDSDVEIASCSFCHNMDSIYGVNINDIKKYNFLDESPIYFKNDEEKLRQFIKKYVKYSSRRLLYDIDDSRIRPSKYFSKMLYDALRGQSIFSLDDGQAASVATIVYETNIALQKNKRKTIIIKGGPGCGKSVVAVNALGQLIHPNDGSDPKNAAYCTVNFTPRTLYSELLINDDYKKAAIKNLFKTLAAFSHACEFEFDCALFDEAHRIFKWKFGQGLPKEVDMIDRAFFSSRVNVWFIDEDQAVTKNDLLTIDLIKKYAKKYNSEVVETDELTLTTQFRCQGGEKYISFINDLLGYTNQNPKPFKSKNYELKVFDTPTELWNVVKKHQDSYKNARLLAGYTHDYKSASNPEAYDFILENGKFKFRWNKKVAHSYILDEDQLENIGSIHTIQGVDMSYAGVIIGKDLIYRDGEIKFDKTQNARTDSASGIRTSSDEEAARLIKNTYKVLLTRAMYGTYIYCEDKALNEYIKSLIINNA